MMNETGEANIAEPPSKRRVRVLWFLLLGAGMLLAAVVWIMLAAKPNPPLRIALGDGRILQIEGITYGTSHRIGHTSLIFERFGPWLPQRAHKWFEPKYPESKIELEHPALVVWVNAINPASGTNVDCQMIRTEFVGKDGDLFAADTSTWHGGQNFWRVGHVFFTFPRDERELTWQVTTWRSNKTSRVKFLNPHLTEPAKWSGSPLPLTQAVGELEIVMTALCTRTNGGRKNYWETPGRYWEPVWDFRQRGEPAVGWAAPEWIAEDATGNRGRFLGVHQRVLKFFATVYPEATNSEAARLIASLPQTDLDLLKTNIWWNKSCPFGTNNITILGLCPPGTQVFSEGQYDSNGPRMGPVQGGAPSGWEGQGQRISPVRVKQWNGHYTPSPTIYIRAPGLKHPDRLGVRLRDEQGQYWTAKPEPGGAAQGIMPFLIELPATVTNVVPEVVVLRPVEAEFMVETKRQ